METCCLLGCCTAQMLQMPAAYYSGLVSWSTCFGSARRRTAPIALSLMAGATNTTKTNPVPSMNFLWHLTLSFSTNHLGFQQDLRRSIAVPLETQRWREIEVAVHPNTHIHGQQLTWLRCLRWAPASPPPQEPPGQPTRTKKVSTHQKRHRRKTRIHSSPQSPQRKKARTTREILRPQGRKIGGWSKIFRLGKWTCRQGREDIGMGENQRRKRLVLGHPLLETRHWCWQSTKRIRPLGNALSRLFLQGLECWKDYFDSIKEEEARWAEVETGLKHGKAVYEAAEWSSIPYFSISLTGRKSFSSVPSSHVVPVVPSLWYRKR
jgi:hypothetical protein